MTVGSSGLWAYHHFLLAFCCSSPQKSHIICLRKRSSKVVRQTPWPTSSTVMNLIYHQILSFLLPKYLSNYTSLSILRFSTCIYAAVIFIYTSVIALDCLLYSLFPPLISLRLESSLKNTTITFLVSCLKLKYLFALSFNPKSSIILCLLSSSNSNLPIPWRCHSFFLQGFLQILFAWNALLPLIPLHLTHFYLTLNIFFF